LIKQGKGPRGGGERDKAGRDREEKKKERKDYIARPARPPPRLAFGGRGEFVILPRLGKGGTALGEKGESERGDMRKKGLRRQKRGGQLISERRGNMFLHHFKHVGIVVSRRRCTARQK